MTSRLLTTGEKELARSIYGNAIDLEHVELRRRRWFPFQPRNVVMAPRGHIHFHPGDDNWRDDFSNEGLALQGLFLHELCHVWQHQRGVCLPLARHPFCRYHYSIVPGWQLQRYGIEQQAEIVRHAFLLRRGATVPGAPALSQYESIIGVFR